MKSIPVFVILFAFGLTVAGCSTTELQQARQSYTEARSDPMIAQNAPAALQDAEMALQKADEARSFDEQIHYAYMAQRNVDLAKLQASQSDADMKAASLAKEQNDLMASLRQNRSEAELRAYRTKIQQMQSTIQNPVFGFDSAELSSNDMQGIEQLSEFMKQNHDINLLVEGFTDSIGDEAYNRELGKRRAEAVARELRNEGISSERIIARGVGEAFPVAPNDTAEGRQQNRRAAITIVRP